MNRNGVETAAGFVSDTNPAFYLQFRPAGLPRAHMVYLPPFAEEMNRCRSLVARQARQFAREGLCCTILDFHGTGESPGELSDASLPIWRQNVDDLLAQLLQCNQCPVYLWGCRLGALLALDYLSTKPGACSRLLFWQPISSGSAFVTQLLRQRTAALIQKGEKPQSTEDMKIQLAAGDSFEVAGYRHSGSLLSAINQLEFFPMLQGVAPDDKPEIFWFEHTSGETRLPGTKASRAIATLQESGALLTVKTFTGDPLWQLHKRGACDELFTLTTELSL